MAATGSICACDRCGTWYSARTVFAADASAAATSPVDRPGLPGFATDAASSALYAAESYDAFGPRSNVTLSALRPCSAAHVSFATTATPPRGRNPPGIGDSGMRTILSTPGTLSASVSSTLATVPPHAGGRAMTATFIPGSPTSAPYTAVPVVIGTEIDRRRHRLALPPAFRGSLDPDPRLVGHRDRPRRGHQGAVALRAPRRFVHHLVVARLHLAGRDAPFLRCRVLEERAHRGAGLAVLREEVADTGGAVRVLRSVLRVAVRLLHAAPGPLGLHLVGDDHGHAWCGCPGPSRIGGRRS